MLQWFIWFPEFAEFSENFSHLGKTPMSLWFLILISVHALLDIFNLDGLVGISRAWLYKEAKVPVLQANAHLAQKGECWTWNQKFIRGLYSILTGFNIYWNYLLSCGKASDANVGIIANFVYLWVITINLTKEMKGMTEMPTFCCWWFGKTWLVLFWNY